MSAASSIVTTGDVSATGVRSTSNEAAREPQREPAMDDILASIRRIIAQDQSLFSGDSPRGDAGQAQEPAGAALEASSPLGEAQRSPPDEIDERVARLYGLRQGGEAPGAAHPDAVEAAAQPDRGVSGLVSPAVETSVAAAFKTLVASRFARNGEAIQAMTREALQPLLERWLDAHLPALVERLVAAEIDRIANGD